MNVHINNHDRCINITHEYKNPFILGEEDEYYIISFIDNNMNTIKIKHNEHVILGESDYFIIECIEKDPEFETEPADTEPAYRCNDSGPK